MSYTLDEFVADVERLTREEADGRALAERVGPLLGRLVADPGAVPERYRRRPPGARRGRWMLHRAERFNVTAVVWGPGDTAPCHDHRTWGAIGVVENAIEETRYRVTRAREVAELTAREAAELAAREVAELTDGGPRARVEVLRVERHTPGAVSLLIPGDEIHGMHNPTGLDTVEIHVYGKDLAGLTRATWDRDGSEGALVSPSYMNC